MYHDLYDKDAMFLLLLLSLLFIVVIHVIHVVIVIIHCSKRYHARAYSKMSPYRKIDRSLKRMARVTAREQQNVPCIAQRCTKMLRMLQR